MQQSNAPNEDWSAIASSADGCKRVAVVWDGGIWTSTNSGIRWIQQTNAPITNWWTVASSANGSNLVVASGAGISEGGIWTSTNTGINWQQTQAPGKEWYSVASSCDGSNLVAVNVESEIWTSANSGANWLQQTGAPSVGGWFSVTSSSNGVDLFAAAGSSSIWASTNSGVTWTQTTAPNGWESIACSSDGAKVVAAGTGIWISTNSGGNWMQSDAPINNTQYPGNIINWFSTAISSDGTKLAAAAYNMSYPETGIWTAQALEPADGPPLTITFSVFSQDSYYNNVTVTWRNDSGWNLFENNSLSASSPWAPAEGFSGLTNGTNYCQLFIYLENSPENFFRLGRQAGNNSP